MEIKKKVWEGENYRAIFNFSDTYKVETVEKQGDFIRSLKFNFNNTNTLVNFTGITQSSTLSLEIYTMDDKLNPTNTGSPYFEELVNGLKVDIYKEDTSTGDYNSYGVWYVSHWNGGFSDGANSVNSLTLEDRLNSEFSADMPELEARGNTRVGDLVAEVFEKIGLSDYVIDAELNTSLTYAVPVGGKVRDFLNSVCALMLARVRVDLQGIVHIEPALSFNDFNNTLTVDADLLTSLQSANTDSINYNKLELSYTSSKNWKREVLVDEALSEALEVGENIFNFEVMRPILSIEQVRLGVLNKKANITDVITSGSGKTVSLKVLIDGEGSNYAEAYIEGIVSSSKKETITKEIEGMSTRGGISYKLDIEQCLTEEEAESLASNLCSFVKLMSKRVTIAGTVINSDIQTGDRLIIQDTGTSYDGEYKVISVSVTVSSDYSCDLELVKIGGV